MRKDREQHTFKPSPNSNLLESAERDIFVKAKSLDDEYLIISVEEKGKIHFYALTLDGSGSLVAMATSALHAEGVKAIMSQIEAREYFDNA